MGVNSLPKTVTRQRRGCDLNTGPSAPESSTLTTRLRSRHLVWCAVRQLNIKTLIYRGDFASVTFMYYMLQDHIKDPKMLLSSMR